MKDDLLKAITYSEASNNECYIAFERLIEILKAWENNYYIDQHIEMKQLTKGA